jgi:hypothetical protein
MMCVEQKENKYIFRKTERKLYQYYEDIKKREIIKKNIEDLKRTIERKKEQIRNCDITIEADIQSVPITERVQTSPTGESAVERGIDRGITNLEKELNHFKKQLQKEETDLINIDLKINKMKHVIDILNEDYKYFINLMYGQALRIEKIADKIHVSKKTAYNTRDKIIKEIISFKML